MDARPSLGEILRPVLAAGAASGLRLSPHQWKTLRALAVCRTAALGGQVYFCPHCQKEQVVAHSCRNRHCPQCQGSLAVEWLARQEQWLLPIPYFHLVFTLPHQLNGLIRQNRRALFNLFFAATSQTLLEFGFGRFHAQIGITMVLHTWGQNLLDHYHLHCIVTGGGLTLDHRTWVTSPSYFLFPVKALSQMFRGKFMAGLRALRGAGQLEYHGDLAKLADPMEFAALLRDAEKPKWNLYAKRPFAGPQQVLAYLSRYTHRVAISPKRLLTSDGHSVTFDYKDYADKARHKTMTLTTHEFVSRFSLHILPERFVKIRHYGLLANRQRQARLTQARQLLDVTTPPVAEASTLASTQDPEPKPLCCAFCGQPGLLFIRHLPPARQPRFDSS